jgi:hypothetical protein
MASASKAEHRLHLEKFFFLLQENGLRINLSLQGSFSSCFRRMACGLI